MNFKDTRKKQLGVLFASDRMKTRQSVENDPRTVVNGIRFCENLYIQPSRSNVFGLLSGTGVGKSTVANIIAKDVLMNNEGYVLDISLEMSVDEKLNRYETVFQDCPELLDRLIVIDNYNEDGSQTPMSITDLKMKVLEIKSVLDDKINLTILDHFHLLDNPNGDNFNPIANKLKATAKELDTLLLVLSQTTKEKSQGDIPVPKNGCFGCSGFENICSYLMTIFQPLRRVQNECELPVMGYQFGKLRNKKLNKDRIREEVNYVLKYDSENEDLLELTSDEKIKFEMYYEKVLELRSAEEKRKSYAFDLSTYVKGKDGKQVRMEKIVGGDNE